MSYPPDLVAHLVIIDYKHAMVTIKGNEIPFTIANGVAITTECDWICQNPA